MTIDQFLAKFRQPRLIVCLGIVIIVFLLGALAEIRTPGIYMDAVNNDYMVARLFSPIRSQMSAWFAPGTVLFDRIPIVAATYVGSLTFFVGLPAYTLLGTSIEAIRVVNAMYGIIVLISAWWFLVRFRAGYVVATLVAVVIALDPAFVFSFRTQFNVTMLPVAFWFLGAVIAEPLQRHPSIKRAVLAGFLSGVALYGYFVYFFALLVSLGYVVVTLRHEKRKLQLIVGWLAGAAIALSPFLIFLIAMTIQMGGIANAVHFFTSTWQQLGPASSVLGLFDRVSWYWFLMRGMVDTGAIGMMVNPIPSLSRIESRDWIAFILLIVGIAASILVRARMRGTVLALACVFSFLPIVLVFGDRLSFHHLAPTVVLLAVATGFGLASIREALVTRGMLPNVVAIGVIAALIAPIAITNAVNRQRVLHALRATGGIGYASDAILNFSEAMMHEPRATTVFMPDWGMFMSFIMVTGGTIPNVTDSRPSLALEELCKGRDVILALMVAQGEERAAQWVKATRWQKAGSTYFDQRDGTHVVLSTRLRADERPPDVSCR